MYKILFRNNITLHVVCQEIIAQYMVEVRLQDEDIYPVVATWYAKSHLTAIAGTENRFRSPP